MGLSSTIFDMIQRSAANRAAIESRREKAAYMRTLYVGYRRRRAVAEEKTVAPEVLAEIKAEIRRTIRRERIRAVVLTLALWLVIAGLAVAGAVFLMRCVYFGS